jgi:hypothetical protein
MRVSKAMATCLLTLSGLSAALPSPSNTIVERAAVSGVTIYAYGSDTNGAPVFYSAGNIEGPYGPYRRKSEADLSI